jgi:GTPase involved in cell partitioning and DNA repair
MKFVDEAIIEVHAGKGGDGVASFGSGYLSTERSYPPPKPAAGASSQ